MHGPRLLCGRYVGRSLTKQAWYVDVVCRNGFLEVFSHAEKNSDSPCV